MPLFDFDPPIRDDPPRLMRRTLRRLAGALIVIAVLGVIGWVNDVAAAPPAEAAAFFG